MLIDTDFLNALQLSATANPRLRQSYDLRNAPTDGSQRMLNVLELGTLMPIHRHPNTSETVILLRGRMDEIFYDEAGTEIERFHLNPIQGKYGVQVPAGRWHSLEVLEPSVLFESKDGPYQPLLPEDIMERDY